MAEWQEMWQAETKIFKLSNLQRKHLDISHSYELGAMFSGAHSH